MFKYLQARVQSDYADRPVPGGNGTGVLGALEKGTTVASYTGEEVLNGLFTAGLLSAPFTPRSVKVADIDAAQSALLDKSDLATNPTEASPGKDRAAL